MKIIARLVLGIFLLFSCLPLLANDPIAEALGDEVAKNAPTLAIPSAIVNAEKLFSRGEILNAQFAYSQALAEIVAAEKTPENNETTIILTEFLLGKLLALSLITGENDDLQKQLEKIAEQLPMPLKLSALSAHSELSLRLGKKALAEKSSTHLWRDYLILAPLANERGHAFAIDLIDENNIPDFTAEFAGKKFPVRWRFFHTLDPRAYLDLTALCTPNAECLAYVAAIIESDENTAATLYFGSDDAIAIFVNGQEVWREDVERHAKFPQSKAAINLRAGLNLVLFKVGQAQDDWGLFAHLDVDNKNAKVNNVTARFAENLADEKTRAQLVAIKNKNGDAVFNGTDGAVPSQNNFDALDFLEAHLKNNPHDTRAVYLSCEILAWRDTLGRHSQTLRQKMMSAMALSTNEIIYPQMLAFLSDESRRFKADRDENMRRLALMKILELSTDDIYALTNLADYYLTAQENQFTARSYLERALAKNRLAPIANLLLAKIYLLNEWNERALMLLENISKRHPTMPAVQESYGDCLLRNGRGNSALSAYLAAIKSNQLNFPATLAAAELYHHFGQSEKAITLWQKYLTLRPYDLTARKKLGELFLSEKKFADAENLIRETLIFSPASAEFLQLHARLLFAQNDFASGDNSRKSAEAALIKAFALNPADSDLRAQLEYLGQTTPQLLSPIADLSEYLSTLPPLPANADDDGDLLNYLCEQVDELDGDSTKRRGVRVISKILTPAGAEKMRRFPIWFDQESEEVVIVNMRALHNDGGVSEAQIVPLNRAGDRQVTLAVFPNLQVGDVVETAYILQQTRPDFFGDYFGHIQRFRKPDFTARSRYVLRAPRDKPLYFHRQATAPEAQITDNAATREWAWEMENLPALPDDDFAPPVNELSPTVQISTFADWNALARWYWGLVKSQNIETAEIAEKVKELCNPIDSARDHLAAIYEWVTTEVRNNMWVFGVHGFKPYNVGAIFTRRFGDCKDKTTLINVMAKGAGFAAFPVLIRAIDFDRGRGAEDLTLPILAHFNHCISLVELPENEKLFLDGTMSYRTIDGLPFSIIGAQAVIVRENGAEIVALPAYQPEDNLWQENTILLLEPNGNADLSLNVIANGHTSVYLRAWFRNEQTWDQVLKAIGAEKYGHLSAAVVNDVVLASENSDVTSLDARLRLRDYTKTNGDNITCRIPMPLLSGEFGKDGALPVKMANFATYSQRATDVLLPTLFKIERQIKIEYPEGWELQNVLHPIDLDFPFGILHAEFNTNSNYLEIKYNLALKKVRITEDEYPQFRRFCLTVDQVLNLDLEFKK